MRECTLPHRRRSPTRRLLPFLARAVPALVLVLAGSVMAAAPPVPAEPPVQTVEVNGLSDPAERSYPLMLKGAALFERHHQQAPNASLNFKLLRHPSDPSHNPLALRIVDKNGARALALGKDDSFTLPREATPPDDNTRLSANRHATDVQWFAEVRSSGLPAGTRRLGDLRLECNVSIVGFVADFPRTPANLGLAMLDNPCGWRGVVYAFVAERAVFGVTLVDGERRQAIGTDMLYGTGLEANLLARLLHSGKDWSFLRDRAYRLPLWDSRWPDDTLVEFDFMDDAALAVRADQPNGTPTHEH
jgi:hypothetical protein